MNVTRPLPSECTVLFADLAESTQLYERVGDAVAFTLVDRCLQAVRTEVERNGGRVVKHTGDGLMAVFEDVDRAADVSIRIHQVVRELPLLAGQKLAMRIGFHYGPVVQNDDDVFGETVNLAARLVELASPDRAITSIDTVRRLDPVWRALLNPLPARMLRGVSRPTELFELVCQSAGDLTVVQTANFEVEDRPEMQLSLGPQVLVVNAEQPRAQLGRDPRSDLRIKDSRASRQHAQIELRGDKFVLVDRSSNGTFVAIEGEREFVLSREEVVLVTRGQIALGGTCAGNPNTITFAHL